MTTINPGNCLKKPSTKCIDRLPGFLISALRITTGALEFKFLWLPNCIFLTPRLVYWCVVYKYGEQLHMDLMIHLSSLVVKRYATLDNTTDESFVVKFNKALVSTFSFIRLVCDIFMYLDRVFCRKELEHNLHVRVFVIN